MAKTEKYKALSSEIAKRASDEIYKKYWNFAKACREIGIEISTARAWSEGTTSPSAYALSLMCDAGYDVIYILTGERSETDA